jgi:hypothetical protein
MAKRVKRALPRFRWPQRLVETAAVGALFVLAVGALYLGF